ncbi:MAG: HNH endonuclease, partial [Archangium sp.]|nr:HNH endonuclease [Archangium sp.]
MGAWDESRKRQIFDRSSGYCHICTSRLSFRNYAQEGQSGAWHVDHSIPRSRGGSDRLSNLYPACIDCNRDKSDGSTRAARARNGVTRAPLSRRQAEEARKENTLFGAGLLGIPILLMGGPVAGALAAVVGGLLVTTDVIEIHFHRDHRRPGSVGRCDRERYRVCCSAGA